VFQIFFASIEKTINYISAKITSRFAAIGHRTESNLVDINKSKTETMRSDFQKTADDIMLSKYSPAGL
jgi:hypothetical protein